MAWPSAWHLFPKLAHPASFSLQSVLADTMMEDGDAMMERMLQGSGTLQLASWTMLLK